MKLLRPLHRQRARRRSRAVILDGRELAEKYDVQIGGLEDYLIANQLPFHKDSQGEIWASVSEPRVKKSTR